MTPVKIFFRVLTGMPLAEFNSSKDILIFFLLLDNTSNSSIIFTSDYDYKTLRANCQEKKFRIKNTNSQKRVDKYLN